MDMPRCDLDSTPQCEGDNCKSNSSNSNETDAGSCDSVTRKDDQPTKLGFREVDWNSFHPDGGDARTSYSDFFKEFEDFSDEIAESGNCSWPGNSDMANPVTEENSSSNESWENMYPGWKYDAKTGQWYHMDDCVTSVGMDGCVTAIGRDDLISNWDTNYISVPGGKLVASCLKQGSQPVMGVVANTSKTQGMSYWNQAPEENNGYHQDILSQPSMERNNGYPENQFLQHENEYPPHMVFDPQYPGWYYDTFLQKWHSLESYSFHNQHGENRFAYGNSNSHNLYSFSNNYISPGQHSHGNDDLGRHSSSYGGCAQENLDVKGHGDLNNTGSVLGSGYNKQSNDPCSMRYLTNDLVNQQNEVTYENVKTVHPRVGGAMPSIHTDQHLMEENVQQIDHNDLSNCYITNKPDYMLQSSFPINQQYSLASSPGRSSAGRPPHALVTFGFGGKLIVVKPSGSTSSTFHIKEHKGGSISLLSLTDVFSESLCGTSNITTNSYSYFRALCHESFPGPLVGGNVGNKELNKWIDERIMNYESSDVDNENGQMLKLLLSLLKINWHNYGKLRSPFGADASLKDSDGTPESAVAKLFTSAKKNGTHLSNYGMLGCCLQNLPSEAHIRATASEMQNFLVSGRKKEALLCAQEGQLWGPALVLAAQMGEKFYVDTIRQMALLQLVAGSPLRTLCLLIAGRPAEVFSSQGFPDTGLNNSNYALLPNGMLDDWEENLAVITANRTKDDELVIMHLGDCLWKVKSEVAAAHICYLVAEANFESYSDSARLCLIGADHWKHPRTYISPEAIQRTEFYEYAKVLGNSQFTLLPFQPYKVVYAHMLAEVGKISESLKYCQALLKSWKSSRASEMELWKLMISSLEERLRTYQQSGYSVNLAPAKLMGKLLNLFDSTTHRVVGGFPPPVPSTSEANAQHVELQNQATDQRVSTSQSTAAMSSLIPSTSVDPTVQSDYDGNRMTAHSRSVSEPNFSGSATKGDPVTDKCMPDAQGKSSSSAGLSRFSRFGFGSQLFQKTVGLVLKPRSDREAKLGETNKFYYDEKLKRWVEEGAEAQDEAAPLPPPPTTTSFNNGTPEHNVKSALVDDWRSTNGSVSSTSSNQLDFTPGIPPVPSSSTQFSARGRSGIRSRYVDTFNRGASMQSSLYTPPIQSSGPAVTSNAKFFIPTPLPQGKPSTETPPENGQVIGSSLSESSVNCFLPPTPATNIQRFPSMGNISEAYSEASRPESSHARRTSSWSGNFNGSFSPPEAGGSKPHGGALNMAENDGPIGDLQEVEL